MPKVARELSALEVGRLKAPGLHPVGGVPGLALQVTPTHARSWILRATVGTKRRDMGLGQFPGVTLAQAREKARNAREQIDQGTDPILQRQQAQSLLRAQQAASVTFEQAARSYIDAKSAEWKNAKHAAQWSATLETYAFPVIGKMHVSDIQQAHVLTVLEPIWSSKTETATRVRGRVELVLDWAKVRGYRTGENPARWRGHLDKLLAAPKKITKVEHHPAVPVKKAADFYEALRERSGTGARALEFALLTAARSGEVRGATWAEIDLDAKLWIVPAERMKGKKEHRVPLSAAAMKLLQGLSRMEGSDLLFPAARGGQLSDMSLTAVMRRMGLDSVPHGLRSTFRDWVAECTNYPRELAERALAHTLTNSVEAAYHRSDVLEKRRALMQDWAKFVATPYAVSGTVVRLPSRKRA
ncbi:integrase arm-type DNA-binding domain-containing protein [Ramlibacter sp. XY19]|uniref:tyrosine-type recombinase/integrase n=1 Tax=Ramlibacter paludis TaxID=2908000 RepID=UPI0023DC9AFA|nr:site-specific integrase [Ramlibacter paludis]MCG2592144.1 integrase arm-type DNA-binding domain-containing protein [Ramlibacter paludis]